MKSIFVFSNFAMKRTLTLLLFSLLISSNSIGQLTFWNDLYAYYPCNGDFLDYSGNELNCQGTAVVSDTGVFGEPSGSWYFNGFDSKIVRNHLTLPDSFTLSGWYYSMADSQATGLIYNGNTGSNGYGIYVKKPFGNFGSGYLGKTLVIHQGGVSENAFNNQFELPTNEWLHLALVRKGLVFELYLNGILQSSGPVVCNYPDGEFSIGCSSNHISVGYPSFKGKVDEIMVFRSALTAENVYKVFQANLTSTQPISIFGAEMILTPNPSGTGNLHINCGKLNIQKVCIFDLLGKKVIQENFVSNLTNTAKLSTAGISPGVYVISVQTDGKTFNKHLQIN